MEKDHKFKRGVEKAKEFTRKMVKETGPVVEIKFFPGKKADDKDGAIVRINKEPITVDSQDHPSVKAAKRLTNALLAHKSEPVYEKMATDAKKALTGRDKKTGILLSNTERAATLGFTAARAVVEVYNVPAKPMVKAFVLPEIERRVMDKVKNPEK